MCGGGGGGGRCGEERKGGIPDVLHVKLRNILVVSEKLCYI